VRERKRSSAAVKKAKAAKITRSEMTGYEITAMKKKLQALSYGGAEGANPGKRLLAQYDRDKTGTLDLAEFTAAVRKGVCREYKPVAGLLVKLLVSRWVCF